MGSGGGVASGFVAQPMAGEAALELLGWGGGSACTPMIVVSELQRQIQSPQPVAGRCQLLGWIHLLCWWDRKSL